MRWDTAGGYPHIHPEGFIAHFIYSRHARKNPVFFVSILV